MILNSITWDISPVIFEIGSFALRWYGLLFATGFYMGYIIVRKFFKIENVSLDLLDSLTIYMIIGSLLGARLGHCLFYEPEYYLAHPLDIIKPWSGELGNNATIGIQGLASHGGVLGVFIALFLFSRKHKTSFIWILDRIAIVAILGGALIRLGNLMNSEIVGQQTDVAWGFIFTRLNEDFARHPTQLYESFSYFIIFGFLYSLYMKYKGKPRNGLLLGWFFVLVFSMRFLIEFIKKNQVVFEDSMTLNMGQMLSIPLVTAGILILLIKPKQKLAEKPPVTSNIKTKKA